MLPAMGGQVDIKMDVICWCWIKSASAALSLDEKSRGLEQLF